MREIKFRAWEKWDGEPAKMVYFDICSSKTIEELATNAIIMQYTGLKDINGREIYEGDIVIWGHIEGWYKEVPVRIAIVEFNPDIQFNCINLKRTFLFGQFAYQDTHNALEVIGNIYENPELLAAHSNEDT